LVVARIEGDRPMAQFVISDTGIGMNEEQLGRLFQAFRQADISTTRKFGGTGLGLAITRHFCQLLGGDIKVTSRQGEGSTFTITLPDSSLAPAQLESVAIARNSDCSDDGITVLVVDDDPEVHHLLAATLKGEHYRLVRADSGEEAMNLAHKIRPDAITIDVLMPKTDGWAVLRALKADSELCDIPVVMITVVPDRGLGQSLGAADVLRKPVDRGHLTTLLRRLVRRTAAASPEY
jgi:CheY-like chemotaxis protein